MRRCGIDEALSARVFNTLSGGEQRRVMLARALVQVDEHHGLLLADEPLAGLDPRHAAAAMSVLREVADRGAAVVVILHELEAALRWCDAVWLMDRGVLVATGSAEQVLTPARLESVYGLKVVRGDVAGTPTFVWSPGRPELSRPTAAV
jgi:iron complex transport system ATP-binding protein